MVNRREFIATSAAAVIALTLPAIASGTKYYVRQFYNANPSYENVRADSIWAFSRAMKYKGCTSIGKIKCSTVFWDEKRGGWDVTASAMLYG